MDDAVGIFEEVRVGRGLQDVAFFPGDAAGPGGWRGGGGYGGPVRGAAAGEGCYGPGASGGVLADAGACGVGG